MSDKDMVVSSAKLRFMRISPRKTRLVADLVRGRDVDWALRTLEFTRKRSAPIISKLIRSIMLALIRSAPAFPAIPIMIIGI